MTLKKHFGQKLKEIRLSLGLSQEKLSEMIDIQSVDTISRYENGTRFPSAEKLEKIKEVLNLKYGDLLDEENNISKLYKNTTLQKINLELINCDKKTLSIILETIRNTKNLIKKIKGKNG